MTAAGEVSATVASVPPHCAPGEREGWILVGGQHAHGLAHEDEQEDRSHGAEVDHVRLWHHLADGVDDRIGHAVKYLKERARLINGKPAQEGAGNHGPREHFDKEQCELGNVRIDGDRLRQGALRGLFHKFSKNSGTVQSILRIPLVYPCASANAGLPGR